MEILLILQPMAHAIAVMSGILAFVGVIIYVVFRCISLTTKNREEGETLRTSSKVISKYLIASSIVFILSLPPTYAWDIYKNILVYRAINSDTADKAVSNINLLMDKLGIAIEQIGDKTVEQVDKVGKAVEPVTKTISESKQE
jgi:hypothetical protein